MKRIFKPVRLFAILAAIAFAAHAAQPVWIDADPAVARGGLEMSDALAMVQAFRSPEIEVRGVSIIFGNAPLERALPSGEEIVRRFGPAGMRVYEGASSAADLGVETEASRALAIALRRERLTILMLGPATTVATVIELHPELVRRITRIAAVAGRRPGQRFTAGSGHHMLRDVNFELNPQAFHVLLKSGVPLTLTPWEAASKVWLSKADFDAHHADPAIEWLYEPFVDWLAVWKRDLDVEAMNPFDTLAVGYLTQHNGYACEILPVEIQRKSDDTGPGPDKPYLQVGGSIRSKFRVEYCSSAGPGFKDALLSKFNRQP